MAVSAGYLETLVDQLAPLGRISIRKMFGGAAVYADGQVFALVDDDVLYLKVGDDNRQHFLDEGCGPFEYGLKDGRVQVLASYYRTPDRLLDEPDELVAWCRKAVMVSRKAAIAKPARKTAPKAVKQKHT